MTANYLNPDFFQKRPTESQTAYEMRIRPYLAHRPDASDEGRDAHATWRAETQDNRITGTGVGLGGADDSPYSRGAALGSPFGSRTLNGNGHLNANVLQTAGQPSLSMLSRLPRKDVPVMAQRTAEQVAQLRSTGAGILGVGR